MWWHTRKKPDFIFRRNGRVHLNRRGRQFSRLLAAEVCASAVVMLDKPFSEVVWRVLATHSIRQFPLHFASRASPCAITFQLDSMNYANGQVLGNVYVPYLTIKVTHNFYTISQMTCLLSMPTLTVLALELNYSCYLQNYGFKLHNLLNLIYTN